METEHGFLLKQNESLKNDHSNHLRLIDVEKSSLETEIRDMRERHNTEIKRVIDMKDGFFERL